MESRATASLSAVTRPRISPGALPVDSSGAAICRASAMDVFWSTKTGGPVRDGSRAFRTAPAIPQRDGRQGPQGTAQQRVAEQAAAVVRQGRCRAGGAAQIQGRCNTAAHAQAVARAQKPHEKHGIAIPEIQKALSQTLGLLTGRLSLAKLITSSVARGNPQVCWLEC